MTSTAWDFTPPTPSELEDREVPLLGTHLQGRRIALLVSGGIAAMKAPLVVRALRRQGAEVVVFASREALRYVTAETLAWASVHPVATELTAEAEHLSDAAPFDAYLLAPATYNSINKLAHGIADTVVTAALASALGRLAEGRTKVLIAPTMHGSLHTPILAASLRALAGYGVRVIPPRDDYGKHNLPAEEVLVAEVCRALARSPLAGRAILTTGGPTPVPIDGVRRLTNIFTGELGSRIAEELYLRGANVEHVHGLSSFSPPAWLPHTVVSTYDEYRQHVHTRLAARRFAAGVFSAGVADYAPTVVLPGKTPSGGALAQIDLRPLPKVIDEVRSAHPELYMVTFKYQENLTHEELLVIARERLSDYPLVVANRGEEKGPHGEQVAHLVTRDGEPRRAVGKRAIAAAIADHLEAV